ncbi:plasmid pRiA4b ORF-3-like protein [Bacteroidales bacterium 6E]|nr:plasmid pRiA4b ORF-3-like protein [Bacteroidales bacterium 6E]
MIYQFKVTSYQPSRYQFSIETDIEHSFQELHQALQAAAGISPFQMASFFVFDAAGKSNTEISEVELPCTKAPCLSMRNTLIKDIISSNTPYIRYTYDLFNDYSFILELTGINMEKNLREPLVMVNGNESPTEVLDEVITNDAAAEKNHAPDYGILDDYYEIFGDIEELTL